MPFPAPYCFGGCFYIVKGKWHNGLKLRHEFNFIMVEQYFKYSLYSLVLKILFMPLVNKIHIFVSPCNIFSRYVSTNSVVTPSCYIYCIYFVSLSLCVSLVCFCAILLTCNLFSFNADVNRLPGSASPYGYSRQTVL